MQPVTQTKGFAFFCLASILIFLSFNDHQANASLVAEKRAPFSSWAGKRSIAPHTPGLGLLQSPSQLIHRQLAEASEDLAKLIKDLRGLYFLVEEEEDEANEDQGNGAVIKRAPFSSWAGKRAPFSSWAGKRAPFSSWAGKKRSSEEIEDDYVNHRFKRSSDEMEVEDNSEDMHVRERRGANSFSAWGGKRSADGSLRRFARNAPVLRVLRPQRAAFSAWGG